MIKPFWKQETFVSTIICLTVMLLLSVLYFQPLLKHKVLQQSDLLQVAGMDQDAKLYRESHPGEQAYWIKTMFSGMPTYTIFLEFKGNILSALHSLFLLGMPFPIGILFFGMAFMFALMRTIGVSSWLALAIGIAYGFSSYNIIIVEAGHYSKFFAIMHAPGLLLAAVLAYRNKPILGGALMAFFMGLQVADNHVQMTYYFGLVLACYVLYELVRHIHERKIVSYLLTTLLLGVGIAIGVAVNATNMLPVYEYSKFSIRGPSELSTSSDDQKAGGLDRDYAFQWSYGREELLTLLIPNALGGSSNGKLGKSSETYKALTEYGVGTEEAENYIRTWPLYWGDQPFTSGPTYFGALICFGFILGLILVDSGLKWALLYATLLSCLLSLGRHSLNVPEAIVVLALPIIFYFTKNRVKLPAPGYALLLAGIAWIGLYMFGSDPASSYRFTDLFFDYVPFYSKFRAVASMLVMASLTMPILAGLGFQEVIQNKKDSKEIQLAVFWAAGITAGLALILAVLGSTFFSFQGPNDANLGFPEQLKKQLMTALYADRADILRNDAIQAVIFIALAAGLLWLFIKKTISNPIIIGIGVSVIMLFNLWLVDKRFVNTSDFRDKEDNEQFFAMKETEQFLLEKDKTYYRVFPMNRNPFNDGRTPYYLNSIGGYNAAKIRRYQQLIDAHISKMNPNVLNMLNTKYIIHNQKLSFPQWPELLATKDGEYLYQNLNAYGNAWICEKVIIVPTPDAALDTLDGVNSMFTAIVEQKDAAITQHFSQDTVDYNNEYIKIQNHDNHKLTYLYHSPKTRFVTFSEVYYPKGWKAFIDEKEVPIIHTNFVLRGLVIPAGDHKIEMRFHPEIIDTTETYSRIASVILIIFIGFAGFWEWRNYRKNQA
ncbi:MAG: YfhO family protein [Bacteroidia bacterium]|nr:YfhO family protein [Bacteroidia bacterium]